MHLYKLSFLIIGFGFLLLIFSCTDPVFWARIKNNSKSDIVIELQFDKENIESVWNGRPYISYLEGIINGGGSKLYFDTINLISGIKLKSTEEFIIEGGVGTTPDFFAIKKMRIIGHDTVVLQSKEEMIAAFKHIRNRNYELEIK